MIWDAANFTPVVLESPFAGAEARNLLYWSRANRHSIFVAHEAPRSSHFYYTQFLLDSIPQERELGLNLGYTLWPHAAKIVFYMDLGFSPGMKAAWKRAEKMGKPREQRFLGEGWEDRAFGQIKAG